MSVTLSSRELERLIVKLENLATRLERLSSIITIPIDFQQFYTTLIENGIIKPRFDIFNIYAPPGYTTTLITSTPSGYYLLFVELLISIFPDHILSVDVFVDDELLFSDSDAVQDKYREPINFLRRFGAIRAVKKNWKVVIKNNSTTDTAYSSAVVSYGIIPAQYYERIYRRFFDVLAVVLELPPYHRR
jgi:hypothetical protein